ncbi:hypothetical protein [Caulobacter ginsengisoli]|uniref:hypothetical protein n=1 Tax=Caulobacter ginsengisoli TaxID=400775 RepID=UPI0027D89FD4|nr:hypothetical protein [Caulobacter ginsengisoli]
MKPRPAPCLVLAVYPTARGFGWACFDGPFTLFESGLHSVSKDKNAACLRKIEGLLERLKPETLVLEAFDKGSSLRSGRIRRLSLSIVTLAADQGLELAVFTKADVQAAFAGVGARTRHEIALAIGRHLPGLAYRTPKDRKNGDSEDKRLSIFNAAALVLTHYHFGSLGLLEALRDAA